MQGHRGCDYELAECRFLWGSEVGPFHSRWAHESGTQESALEIEN